MVAIEPATRLIARANRAFLGRAVQFLASEGISQFIDIGSGIPTQLLHRRASFLSALSSPAVAARSAEV